MGQCCSCLKDHNRGSAAQPEVDLSPASPRHSPQNEKCSVRRLLRRKSRRGAPAPSACRNLEEFSNQQSQPDERPSGVESPLRHRDLRYNDIKFSESDLHRTQARGLSNSDRPSFHYIQALEGLGVYVSNPESQYSSNKQPLQQVLSPRFPCLNASAFEINDIPELRQPQREQFDSLRNYSRPIPAQLGPASAAPQQSPSKRVLRTLSGKGSQSSAGSQQFKSAKSSLSFLTAKGGESPPPCSTHEGFRSGPVRIGWAEGENPELTPEEEFKDFSQH